MPTAGGFQSGPGELGRRSPAAAGKKEGREERESEQVNHNLWIVD